MRDHQTGMISGHIIEAKGDSDKYVVGRLLEDISDWGRTDIILKTDGEPAINAVQRATAEGRRFETIPENPPAYSPQSNGTAERAVQEMSNQLRSLKLALESRVKVPIASHWKIMHLMIEHAGYLLCRFLKGADGKSQLGRLRGREPGKAIVEFGEQVWGETTTHERLEKEGGLASKMGGSDLGRHIW